MEYTIKELAELAAPVQERLGFMKKKGCFPQKELEQGNTGFTEKKK